MRAIAASQVSGSHLEPGGLQSRVPEGQLVGWSPAASVAQRKAVRSSIGVAGAPEDLNLLLVELGWWRRRPFSRDIEVRGNSL